MIENYVISTHTLTWSVTRFTALTLYYTNFNSHAHVERDTIVFCLLSLAGISTHTLTWSVTRQPCGTCENLFNFNSHAHVERDDKSRDWLPECVNFNSHAHVERDYQHLTLLSQFDNFNSHAHVERDLTDATYFIFIPPFQLTRSRGA